MVDNTDCFAYIPFGNHGRCSILNNADCQFCKFFKTREEFIEGLKKYPPDINKFVPRKNKEGIQMKRPILRYITTCPHCHNRLQDETRDGIEVKVCYSDVCMVECGDKGKVWEAYDYDNNGD